MSVKPVVSLKVYIFNSIYGEKGLIYELMLSD